MKMKRLNQYYLSPASVNQLKEIQEIVSLCDLDEFETSEFEIDVKETWETTPLEDTVVVTNDEQQIVGYGFVKEMGEGRLDSYGFVLPSQKGKGIGGLIIDYLEQLGQKMIEQYKEKGIKYEFNNVIPFTSESAKKLLTTKGYNFKRVYSLKSIDFEEPPQLRELPSNIQLKVCETKEDMKIVYDIYCDSFQDSNSFYPKPFDLWEEEKISSSDDISLWYIAYLNLEPAGFIIGDKQLNKLWVDLLGTKRTARKYGIGTILLNKMYHEAFKRGLKTVSLTVDEYSLTNPSRLYDKAGMKTIFQVGMYEKKL